MEQSICGLGIVEARIQLRGIRLPPQLWNSSDLLQRSEFLRSWGFNALILDVVDLPLVEPFHQDEDRPAHWEEKIAEVAEELQNLGWWVMAVLPVQLDLGNQNPGKPLVDESIPCRQAPLHRRRILHRFETILKGMRGLDALGIAVNEWPRCRCATCTRITFEEESAYYLRAFNAVMKRYAKDLEFWILPDSPSFSLLQEIRAEVPSTARFLVGPQDPEQKGGLVSSQAEEGLAIDLSISTRYEWLNTDLYNEILLNWEQEAEPRLLVAEADNSPRFCLNLASFMRLAWQTRAGGTLPEAWLYRLVLPEAQWKDWRKWRELNLLTLARIQRTGKVSQPLDIDAGKTIGGSGYSPFQPDLPDTLYRTHVRLDLEDRIRPLLAIVYGLPEGIPLDWHQIPELTKVLITLSDLLQEEWVRSNLEIFELRTLENLHDRISLLLSESRAGSVWRRADVPDLITWYELLRDEEPPGF